MNGIWRCAKYAFAPNYLKYCGPDKNKELAGYLTQSVADAGLKSMLEKFEAMHPYLQLIAHENGIGDEFDKQVVEAYWLGNEMLDRVTVKGFFEHAKTRLSAKERKWFELKLPQGAKPNHQFHVFNFMKRTGRQAILHTVETMDQCRISWGKIFRPQPVRRAQSFATPLDASSGASPDILRASVADGRNLLVKTDQLIYRNGKLILVPAVKKFHNLVDGFKQGDLVTLHWGWVCEKITPQQIKNLAKYTALALRLANQTL